MGATQGRRCLKTRASQQAALPRTHLSPVSPEPHTWLPMQLHSTFTEGMKSIKALATAHGLAHLLESPTISYTLLLYTSSRLARRGREKHLSSEANSVSMQSFFRSSRSRSLIMSCTMRCKQGWQRDSCRACSFFQLPSKPLPHHVLYDAVRAGTAGRQCAELVHDFSSSRSRSLTMPCTMRCEQG